MVILDIVPFSSNTLSCIRPLNGQAGAPSINYTSTTDKLTYLTDVRRRAGQPITPIFILSIRYDFLEISYYKKF